MADLDALVFRKVQGRLAPADLHASEWLSHVPEGREITMTGRLERNPRFLRLAWGLLRLVVDNTDKRWPTPRALLNDLKKQTGLYEEVMNKLTGEIEIRLGSISFAAMDEIEFRMWFDRAVYVLAHDVLDTAPQELVDEVFAMVEGKHATPWKVAA